MKVNVYDINAKKVGDITLDPSVFGVKVNEDLISLAVRAYLANQRSAFAKSKTRSQVAGTSKKMWAQKGTGRARHGNAKAPQFVGGGKAHGPRGDQNYTLSINKKQKALALKSVLTKFASNNSIIVVDKLSSITPKTKEASKLLTGLMGDNEVLSNSRKIGLVTSKSVPTIKRAFGNLDSTNLLTTKTLSVYHVANQNFLIFTKKAIENLTKRK